MIILGTWRRSRKLFAVFVAALFANDAYAAGISQSVMEARESLVTRQLQLAQLPPDEDEMERYKGLHAAVARGDVGSIKRLVLAGVTR